ncbi:MAG: glycoside hydrolase family 172 protein [Alphaproteobacteria bacterium]
MFTDDPSRIPIGYKSRAVSFENPTGAPGKGGQTFGGRKGDPNKMMLPGECVTLMDMTGPGRVTHFWLTVPPMPPEIMRSLILEAWYDGDTEPSISCPLPDFFGASLGRPVPLNTAYTAIQEGRGFNSTIPMPFHGAMTIKLTNHTKRIFPLYYQIDLLMGPQDEDCGLLHVIFNRENPTTMKQDFTLVDGVEGPGRFFGAVVGIRVLNDLNAQHLFSWYGEGEFKFYLDNDTDHPTICGTGLEDYAGTAWGMGAHQAPLSGVPHEIADPESNSPNPDFASLYRWHGPDPIMFDKSCRATVQQIGAVFVPEGMDQIMDQVNDQHDIAGQGWIEQMPGVRAFGIVERQDDFSAASFLYLIKRQAVPSVDPELAAQDMERLPYEKPSATEERMAAVGATVE